MESDKAKLFIGGISRGTSEEDLTAHFQKYGTVLNTSIAKDKATKFPRGFGFVQFSDSSYADLALRDSHAILGRTVDVKRAMPRNDFTQSNQHQQNHSFQQRNTSDFSRDGVNVDCFRNKKVFVGGLPASLTEEQFKSYFERFGRIIDVVVMQDSSTNRPRGFGFITFDSEDSVDKALMSTRHDLNGRSVEVKRAVPKDEINSNGNNYGGRNGTKPSHARIQPSTYSPYDFGYQSFGSFPGFNGYVYGTDVYGRGYPWVGYNRIGYGVNPIRANWNGQVVMCALPYGNACVYPGYLTDSSGLYTRPVPVQVPAHGWLNGVSGYVPNNGASGDELMNLDVNGLKLDGDDG